MSFFRSIANRFGLLTKAQFRAATAGLEAGILDRLTNDWSTATLSADAQARDFLPNAIARCRNLRDNFDFGRAFIRMAVTNVVGQGGVHFKNKAKDPDQVQGGRLIPGRLDVFANKVIEDQFYAWGRKENCTVGRNLTWCDVQKVVLESCATDGSILIRKVRGFDNPFGFALQLFDFDFVDFHLNVPRSANNRTGNEIRMGIEINQWHQPVNYYLLRHNPNDSYYGLESWGPRHTILPASEVVQPFIKYRPRQTHGIPWMVTPARLMKMLKGYEEAELVASRGAAAKSLFFKRVGDASYQGPDDGTGNKLMDIEPGSAEVLPEGLEPFVYDPQHPNSQYPQVVKAWLRSVAAGLGTSYHTLANDMEAVNFASGMIGLGEERDFWKSMQYWFIEDFCEPIFEPWLEMAIITGRVPLPMSKFDKFNVPYFSGRRWEFVNPDVETSALERRLKLRLTSVSRELAKMNIDRDELFQEIEDDRKEMEARGILPEEVLESMKNTAGPELDEETKFKQQAWLGFQKDGTVSDVMANMTDIGDLTKQVGIPVQKDYEEPWLPVMADNGQPVTGETLTDSEGDIVGGEAEEPPAPTVTQSSSGFSAPQRG